MTSDDETRSDSGTVVNQTLLALGLVLFVGGMAWGTWFLSVSGTAPWVLPGAVMGLAGFCLLMVWINRHFGRPHDDGVNRRR